MQRFEELDVITELRHYLHEIAHSAFDMKVKIVKGTDNPIRKRDPVSAFEQFSSLVGVYNAAVEKSNQEGYQLKPFRMNQQDAMRVRNIFYAADLMGAEKVPLKHVEDSQRIMVDWLHCLRDDLPDIVKISFKDGKPGIYGAQRIQYQPGCIGSSRREVHVRS